MHFGAKLLSRDCVAYTSLIKSPYGSKLPTAFFSFLCTYLSNTNLSGADAVGGNTRSHPEHDG